MTNARPADTYRGARRNRCLRSGWTAWNQSWYAPTHRANYTRGWPTFAQRPGRYPKGTRGLLAAFVEARKVARMKRHGLLLASLSAQFSGR